MLKPRQPLGRPPFRQEDKIIPLSIGVSLRDKEWLIAQSVLRDCSISQIVRGLIEEKREKDCPLKPRYLLDIEQAERLACECEGE